MNYEELKKAMTKDITDIEYKKSILGIIECHEAMGKTVAETMEYFERNLQKESR